MSEVININVIISNWFLFWFFIYIIAYFFKEKNEISQFIYKNTNPLFLFISGKITILIFLFYHIIFYNLSIAIYIKQIIGLIFFKLIPIFYLYYHEIRFYENILFSISFILLYLMFLEYKNENVFYIYNKIYKSNINDENNTPLTYFLNLIYVKIIDSL